MSANNKQIVTDAYQRIFADGPEGVKQVVQMLVSQGVPKQKFEFKHVIADDDIVILHTPYEMAGKEWRFIDIYRVENNKWVEHWDAMMPMPETRADNNPMF